MHGRRSFALRSVFSLAGCMLLLLALVRIPAQPGGQSAVSLSRPGQEDLTFWVNHNGLDQFDVEGEVGFGDMARILMRRRVNSAAFRALRDRFTFTVREPAALTTDDVFQATIGPNGLNWRNKTQSYRAAAGRILNVPLVVENPTDRTVPNRMKSLYYFKFKTGF